MIPNGERIYIFDGYYAGHYGIVAAFYYEKNSYSVDVDNGRTALISVGHCEPAPI